MEDGDSDRLGKINCERERRRKKGRISDKPRKKKKALARERDLKRERVRDKKVNGKDRKEEVVRGEK